MATTYGVDRERRAQAPAVPPDVDRRRQKVMLVLGTLTGSVSYSAGLSPPDQLWPGMAHTAGMPLIEATYLQRYVVFFYCNAAAFVASLAVIWLVDFPVNQRIKWYAQRVAMTLSLLGLFVSNYVARSCLSFMSSVWLNALAMVVLLSIAIQILESLCKPVEISLSSVQETPQKCLKLLRSKKKKYLLKLEQKDHQQQIRVSGQGSGDAYQILKRSRMHLLLLGTLTASVTYQAGLNPWGGFWQGNHQQYLSGERFIHDKRYLVFFFCNVSAFVIHVVVFLLQVFLACTLWWQALREKMEHCSPGWLKKLFGLPVNQHTEDDDDDDDDDDDEEEEEVVTMEQKQEQRRKLLLLLAILAAILAYHGSASPRPNNLVTYQRLASQYCNATVFIASLSIITMLANRKLEARGVRWHALRVCVILEVIGLTGAFAAGGHRKISTIDVLVLVLAVLLSIAFHVTMFISGTARGLLDRLVVNLGSPQLLVGADPFAEEDNGTEDELEFGIAGGTSGEPFGLEISSPILGGALTLILAIPVMAILANPMKLLVAIMIASIGVSIWRRSFARLLQVLARALQRRCAGNLQGNTATPPPTGSSSSSASTTHREQLVSAICHGLCKVIHTLCLGTWMWLLILIIWVPPLGHNLKLKFKMSKISTVLGVLVVGAPTMAAATTDTPDMPTATSTGTSTTATTTMDNPTTAATTTVTGTPTTAATAASSTSMGRGDEPRPRRSRRPNSRLIGQDWVN